MNPLFLAYGALGGAIVCEVIATTLLQKSEQFTRPWPTSAMALCYVASFYALSQALKVLPPTIAISAKDSIVNLLPAARMLGACHTLHKPFTADELLAAVATVFRHDTPPPPRTNRRT